MENILRIKRKIMLEFQINLLNISTYFLNMVFNDSMINLYFYQIKL